MRVPIHLDTSPPSRSVFLNVFLRTLKESVTNGSLSTSFSPHKNHTKLILILSYHFRLLQLEEGGFFDPFSEILS